ncbi:MAG: DUF1320 domain-containing protein [Pseudanabaenaceae cyanobacterium bins.68]|nr:DUF1320 domain-containing protein [Pseudanabaenaceae cyanobacterium bins.68]
MTYAIAQDFIDNFGLHEIVALTNPNNAAAIAVDLAVLGANQNKAFALINGLIANCPEVRSLMPFSQPVPLLTAYELDITRYYLDSTLAREDVRKRFEDAVSQLKMIGRCELSLGLIGNPPTVQESTAVEVGVIETVGFFGDLHGY